MGVPLDVKAKQINTNKDDNIILFVSICNRYM